MGDLYHINADEFVQARLRWGAGGDAGSRYIRFLNGTFRPSAGVKQEEKDDWSPFLSALAAHEQEVCP